MLSVKINGEYLDAEKISLRLERTRPGVFSFVLPKNYEVDLEDQVKIYRNGSHIFTGTVERIVKRHDPEVGVEVQVSGRDLSAKLARRVIYDEILEGEPRDLVRAMCMPHLKLHARYGVHTFDKDYYENWRYGYMYNIQYNDGFVEPTWGWEFHGEQYYKFWSTYGTGGIYPNYSKKIAPIQGDVYLSAITWGHVGNTYWGGGHVENWWGILARYIDDDNWLAGCCYCYYTWLDYPPDQPVTHYWYYTNRVEIWQKLDGTLTRLAYVDCPGGWVPDETQEHRKWWEQSWIHMTMSLTGNVARLWVKNLRRISQGYNGSHEVSATFDPSLTEGRVGLYARRYKPSVRSHYDDPNYVLFRYFQASKNPVADLDANLYASEAGLAGALTRRLLWESREPQAEGQWFKLDLGGLKWISRVKIVQDLENYARNWRMEVSPDDSNWIQVASRSNDYSPIIDATFTSQYARYVKITITAADSHRWGIAEAWAYFSDGDWLLACNDGNLDAYGEPIAFRIDSATALETLYKIVDTCGWLFWVDKDGYAHFKARRGADKSSSVKFGDSGVKIVAGRRDVDLKKAVNLLHYEGHGSTPSDERRLFVRVEDPATQATHGVLAERKSGKELIRPLALGRRASSELDRGRPSRTEWRLD